MAAEAVVHTMAFQNGPGLEVLPERWTLAPLPEPKSDVSEGVGAMFSPGYLWGVTLPLGFMFFALNFATQGTLLWLPEYMLSMGFTLDEINLQWTLIAAAEGLAVIVSALFIDSGQRKVTLCLSFLLAGACLLGAVATPEHPHYLVIYVMGWGFWEEFAWICLYIVAGEVYPSSIRNTATGLVMGPTRAGGVWSSFIGGDLMDVNPGFPFMINGFMLIAAAIAAMLLSADKTGKPLSDVVEENPGEDIGEDNQDAR